MRIPIIAFSHAVAREVARDFNLGTSLWVYVSGPDQLHGIDMGSPVIVETSAPWTEAQYEARTFARSRHMQILEYSTDKRRGIYR